MTQKKRTEGWVAAEPPVVLTIFSTLIGVGTLAVGLFLLRVFVSVWGALR